MNIKVFNLVLGVNETRFLVQHESCGCKCRLNESICNSKLNWNHACEHEILNIANVSLFTLHACYY